MSYKNQIYIYERKKKKKNKKKNVVSKWKKIFVRKQFSRIFIEDAEMLLDSKLNSETRRFIWFQNDNKITR